MISRSTLAAVLAVGISGAALAQVNVKTPDVQVKTPAGGVELDIDIGSKMKPTEAWVGRPIYSSEGKNVGEVAAIANDQIYADLGGFLGIGQTRVLLGNGQLADVQPDRIVLKLSEAEVKKLPSTDAKPAPPK